MNPTDAGAVVAAAAPPNTTGHRRQIRTAAVLVAVLLVVQVFAVSTRLGPEASATAVVATDRLSFSQISDLVTDSLADADDPLRGIAGFEGFRTIDDPRLLPLPESPYRPPPPLALPTPDPPPRNPYEATPQIVLGQLEIPRLGVRQDLQAGVTLTAINRGPAHWPGTALPGQIGNVVVAGHRTTYSRPFRNVDQLEPGDTILFRMRTGELFRYAVTSVDVVTPDSLHIIDQTPRPTATFFACHPPGSARYRIVVTAELASDPYIPPGWLN